MSRHGHSWRISLVALACVAGCQQREPASAEGVANANPAAPRALQAAAPAATPAPQPSAPTDEEAVIAPVARHLATATEPPSTPAPPGTPRRLSATALSSSEVALAWEASTEPAPVKSYEVFRGPQLLASIPEHRFVVTGLRAGAYSCYSIRAVDGLGQRSPRTPPACCTTLDTSPPSVPASVTVATRPHNEVAVSWAASTDDVGVAGYEVWRGGVLAKKVPATSFADAGLTTLKEYCYEIRAFDAAGNRSAASAPACVVVPDTSPPSVPDHVEARARDEHVIALTWARSHDDVGVARYESVEVDAAAASSPVATMDTAAMLTGFAASTRHCFTVRACDAAGNCSEPSAAACATTPDLTPPSTPVALAVANGDEAIEVRWQPSTDNVGVVGYAVLRADKVVGRTGPDVLAFADSGLCSTVEYCYRVEALDAAGNRSTPSARACVTLPDLKPPTTPGRPAAVAVSSSQLFLAWDPSTDNVGVAGYEVLRNGAVVARVTATRTRERGLGSNRSYCYSVRAYDSAGNRSAPAGPFCAMTSRPTDLAGPSDLRVRRVSALNVLLEWEPSEEAGVTYVVYANGSTKIGWTGRNDFTPSGSLGAKADCYRVAAVDREGRESPRSNEVCAGVSPSVTQR
jgi:chitodextrinase